MNWAPPPQDRRGSPSDPAVSPGPATFSRSLGNFHLAGHSETAPLRWSDLQTLPKAGTLSTVNHAAGTRHCTRNCSKQSERTMERAERTPRLSQHAMVMKAKRWGCFPTWKETRDATLEYSLGFLKIKKAYFGNNYWGKF